MVNNTLDYIDDEFATAPDALKKNLKKKYESLAEKLSKEIKIYKRNENDENPIPVMTLTPIQQAQVEIGKFQRKLLLQIHKDGAFSDTAIKQVERSMDIDDLKFDQFLPKEEK